MQDLPDRAAVLQLLRYQRCDACQAAQTLKRYACSQCGSTRLQWMEASGRGTVYAVTEVSRAPSEPSGRWCPTRWCWSISRKGRG